MRGETQDDEEEEYEVEEVADDVPMRIADRVFLGSIDAARNTQALQAANIGVTLALLGASDERVHVDTAGDFGPMVKRVLVEMEDSLDERLFDRLPMLIAMLQEIVDDAAQRDCNVLVHCMAGRSRSPSLAIAWLMATNRLTRQAATERVASIRPWIEINSRFRSDLERFDRILRVSRPSNTDTASWMIESERQSLVTVSTPRLDFGASLVADILSSTKRVTMRLVSDVENDRNSDLSRIFPHSTAVATSGSASQDPRAAFAVLRVDRVDADTTLAQVSDETLQKTGFVSTGDVLRVLQSFYPHVTMATPLLVVHFTCLGSVQ